MRQLPLYLLLAGLSLTTSPMQAAAVRHAPAATPAEDSVPQNLPIINMAATGTQHLTIGAGKSLLVHLSADAREVIVTDPKIAAATARTPQDLVITGHKSGSTNAFIFDAHNHRLVEIDIRVDNGSAELTDLLNSAIAGARIRVVENAGNIILTGTVRHAEDARMAESLAGSSSAGVAAGSKVVDALQVTGTEQVMLKVRIAEMQRAISKQLGIDITQAASNVLGATVISASTSNPYGIVGAALSDSSQMAVSNGNLSATMKALESVGLAHSLAEPNLIAVSGETAKFLAGGEFPVASGRDTSGNVSVTFKQYGVGLAFTPVVLSPGRISIKLSTEVSELTNTGSLTVTTGTTSTSSSTSSTSSDSDTSNSTTIPALTVRRAETTIELPSGGSFAIAGLMQHTTKQQIEGFPGLKDLPVLGALFRSRDFENDETELVVLVTAYLVHPTAPEKLTSPTAGFVIPTDAESLLLGRLTSVYNKNYAQTPLKGNLGFIVK